jgi:hypothetical protein
VNYIKSLTMLFFLALCFAAQAQTVQPTCGAPFKVLARQRISNINREFMVVEWTSPKSHDWFIGFAKSCRLGSALGYPQNSQTRFEFDKIRTGPLRSHLLDTWVGGVLAYEWFSTNPINNGFIAEDGNRTKISVPGGWCSNKSCFAPGEPDGNEYYLGYSKTHAGLYADKELRTTMKRGLIEFVVP